jgi:hypothetical protein
MGNRRVRVGSVTGLRHAGGGRRVGWHPAEMRQVAEHDVVDLASWPARPCPKKPRSSHPTTMIAVFRTNVRLNCTLLPENSDLDGRRTPVAELGGGPTPRQRGNRPQVTSRVPIAGFAVARTPRGASPWHCAVGRPPARIRSTAHPDTMITEIIADQERAPCARLTSSYALCM